jgi:hypothetical protein
VRYIYIWDGVGGIYLGMDLCVLIKNGTLLLTKIELSDFDIIFSEPSK